MSVIIDSDNNNVDITEEPINVTISTGGADVSAVWGNITGDLIDQTDLQNALDGKVDENAAITGATKTKITYDSKGLVTAGADAGISDINGLQTALDGKVPYTGATGDVNLGEYGIQLGNLEFDNTPTNVPTAAGSVYWSDTDGTLNMVLKGGQTISRIGETQHIRALNNTGAQIARGKVVYVVGAQGQRLTIALADADTEILSKDTIGFTSEAIADGAEGFVIVQGVINNVNTNGMSDGATVYLSQTAGGYTTTPPVDPAHLVVLGFIVNGGSGGAGSIYVKVDNGYELNELHDVNTTGATNGQVLTYNGTTWIPATNGSGTVTSIATSAPITGGTITTSGTIGITQAGAAADGYLSSVDWNTFNNKQAALNLTTTGTSGAATLVGSTLNIPQYQAALTNPVTGTGTAGQVAYWSGTTTQTGSNNLFWDAANSRLGVGLNTGLTARAHIRGSGTTSATTALLVQNSTPANLLTVTDDGRTAFGSSASSVQIYPSGLNDNTSIGGDSLTFNIRGNINSLTHGGVTFSGDTSAITSGNHNVVAITKPFSPTSGSAGFRYLSISPVINQTGGANGITRGLYVNPTLTSAADWRSVEFSNNTGWGLYGAGTANNYLAGGLGIGATGLTQYGLRIGKNITGGVNAFSVGIVATVQSDVTTTANVYYSTVGTAAASFTLGTLRHFHIDEASFGLGSSVTNQRGFSVGAMSGATNNYGFYGDIASGTGRWNLYMNGTAANYLAGNLGVGITTPSTLLEVSGLNGSNIIRSTTTSNLGSTAWVGQTAHDIQFYNADPSGPGIYSAIRVIGGPDSGNVGREGTADYDLTIWTGGYTRTLTERLRINSYGNVSIGTTTSSGRLTVRGAGTTSATNGLLVEDSAGTDTFTIRDDGGYAFKGGTVGLAQTGYTTFTNLTTDRTCDANATTVEELADILGTLIEDLKTKGIIAA